MADKVKFGTGDSHKPIYEVQNEQWLDHETYVIIFQDMFDVDGDKFHLEVEYHKDEEQITYTQVYEDENVGDVELSPFLKKQIDEYILHQVGVLRPNSFLSTETIGVELTLDVPHDMKIGEFQEWLKNLSIEINRIVPTAKEELMGKIKILGITNKGVKYGK